MVQDHQFKILLSHQCRQIYIRLFNIVLIYSSWMFVSLMDAVSWRQNGVFSRIWSSVVVLQITWSHFASGYMICNILCITHRHTWLPKVLLFSFFFQCYQQLLVFYLSHFEHENLSRILSKPYICKFRSTDIK